MALKVQFCKDFTRFRLHILPARLFCGHYLLKVVVCVCVPVDDTRQDIVRHMIMNIHWTVLSLLSSFSVDSLSVLYWRSNINHVFLSSLPISMFHSYRLNQHISQAYCLLLSTPECFLLWLLQRLSIFKFVKILLLLPHCQDDPWLHTTPHNRRVDYVRSCFVTFSRPPLE